MFFFISFNQFLAGTYVATSFAAEYRLSLPESRISARFAICFNCCRPSCVQPTVVARCEQSADGRRRRTDENRELVQELDELFVHSL